MQIVNYGKLYFYDQRILSLQICNFLGHFVMTNLLVKKMVETAKETGVQGRIVNVSSSIHGWFSGDAISYLALISRNKRCCV